MKKHTGLIIGLIAAVVVLGGGALTYVLAGEYIANNFALLTKSDTEYYKWLTDRRISQVTKMIEISEKEVSKNSEGSTEDTDISKLLPASETKLDMVLHLEDSFCDTLGIYSLKDIGISTVEAVNDGIDSASVSYKYGSNNVLTINALMDMTNQKFYAQVPEYSEGVVEIISLIESLGSSMGDLMGDAAIPSDGLTNGYSAILSLADRDIDISEMFDEYAHYFTDSVSDVTITKKTELAVGEKEKKTNAMKITMQADELKTMLGGLVEKLYVDGLIAESDVKDNLDKIIDAIDQTTCLEIVDYLDSKGHTAGMDIIVSEKATKVEQKITAASSKDETDIWYKININSLCALDTVIAVKNNAENSSATIELVPGAFVQKLIGDKMSPTMTIEISGSNSDSKVGMYLKDGGELAASLEINQSKKDYSEPVFTIDDKKIYQGDEVMNSDYINLSNLVSFALNIVDAIDEDYFDNAVNKLIESLFGAGADMDTVREYLDQGYFDMLGGLLGFSSDTEANENIGDQAGTADTEADDNQDSALGNSAGEYPAAFLPEGIVSVDPADYAPKTYEYPKASDKYYYAHSYLAAYCVPAEYKGLTYEIPQAEEITPEMFEEAKASFLADYDGFVTYPSDDLTVDWGDEIYVDIVPVMNGMTMDMFAYPNSYAKIGDEMYGEGLDEEIVGMKIGETKDIEAVIGEEFGSFAGTEGVFRVTVKEIYRYMTPAWTEEFICGGLGYSSLDECSDYIMSLLNHSADISPDNIAYELTSKVKAESKFTDVPDDIYLELYQEDYDAYYDITYFYGMRPEEYLISVGYTEAEVAEMFDSDVRAIAGSDSFYAAIAEKEDIYITGSELIDIINDYLDYYEYDSFEELMEAVSLQAIVNYEIEYKVEQLIYSKAIIK